MLVGLFNIWVILMSKSNQILWYEDPTFAMSVEPYKEVVFLHIKVVKWSKTVILHMFDILQEIEQGMSKLGFVYLLMYNPDQCRSWIRLVTKYAKGTFIGYMANGLHVYGKDLKCLST